MNTTTSERVRVISYTIGEHFAPLVAYGETDGLSRREVEAFADLERDARDNAPEGYTFAHWDIDTDDRDNFAECEATGLMGACLNFEAVYFHNDA